MFAQELRTARKAAGLSQSEVARRAGTSQSRVSSYELGSVVPSGPTQVRLLAAVRLRPSAQLALRRAEVATLARHHGLTNPRVFGSVARDSDGPESDVDLLVTAAPGVGLLAVSAFALAAEQLLGTRVDVVTDGGLDPTSEIALEAVPL